MRDSDGLNHEKTYIRKHFQMLRYRLRQFPEPDRARLQGAFAQELLDDTAVVDTPRGPLSFVALGKAGSWRPLALMTKQPGTIEWIESFHPNSTFWDVGANIGVYALYAALREDMRVVAFEPAAVNYFLLTANCEANKLDGRMDCFLLGLGDERAVARLEVSQFEAGRSFSFRGKENRPWPARQAALVLPIDQLVEEYGLACPNYVKIDVPAFTKRIIAGAVRTLSRPELRGLHVEMIEDSASGRQMLETLTRSGFVLAHRDAHGSSTDVTFVRRDA
jgi:FkbM family methyltransferase